MMHRKNFVAAIRVNGKVLRESNDRVELPFGSEYSILLKNLDTVRQQAQISIDGKDATSWLVLNPGEKLNIERFLGADKNRGNRFKFIERTERIEEHRGIQVEDGLIRIEFKRERIYEAPKVEHVYRQYHDWYSSGWPYYPHYVYNPGYHFINSPSYHFINSPSWTTIGSSTAGTSNIATVMRSSVGAMNYAGAVKVKDFDGSAGPISNPVNEAGITVSGSLSNQRFISVADFETEQSEVLVLHLVGRKADKVVQVAKTVDTRVVCDICGKNNNSTSKFCFECGTFLGD
jgi:hypothetical protein